MRRVGGRPMDAGRGRGRRVASRTIRPDPHGAMSRQRTGLTPRANPQALRYHHKNGLPWQRGDVARAGVAAFKAATWSRRSRLCKVVLGTDPDSFDALSSAGNVRGATRSDSEEADRLPSQAFMINRESPEAYSEPWECAEGTWAIRRGAGELRPGAGDQAGARRSAEQPRRRSQGPRTLQRGAGQRTTGHLASSPILPSCISTAAPCFPP